MQHFRPGAPVVSHSAVPARRHPARCGATRARFYELGPICGHDVLPTGIGPVLKYLQLKAAFGWSLSNLVALVRQQLFVYRDLYTWLDDPFQAPPALAGVHDGQLALEF
jgi:hypothetical protein